MQGECLSSFLFGLYIKEINAKINEILSISRTFDDREILILKYANDLVLSAKTSEGLQAGRNALYEFCITNCLKVNTEKSKVMYLTSKKSKKLSILYYNHKALQSVDSFKYLGIKELLHVKHNARFTVPIVSKYIHKLKRNSAPAADGITAEL